MTHRAIIAQELVVDMHQRLEQHIPQPSLPAPGAIGGRMISAAKTLGESTVPSWPIIESDEVVRLREWGTNKIHMLPQPPC